MNDTDNFILGLLPSFVVRVRKTGIAVFCQDILQRWKDECFVSWNFVELTLSRNPGTAFDLLEDAGQSIRCHSPVWDKELRGETEISEVQEKEEIIYDLPSASIWQLQQ
jgi:hypothetical protein